MKIINPLYDTAFKYLMENEKLAKKIISTIIECEVLSLEMFPQETAVDFAKEKTKKAKKETVSEYLSIYRLDFKAVIRNEKNEEQLILIEVQKSRYPDPIDRFRQYLGANYMKKEKFFDKNGVQISRPLPIITIYFLGYTMSEYDAPAIFVDNQVFNAVTKEKIEVKNDFVKLLTHRSYVLQVLRIPVKKENSRLMQLLSIFDQSCQTDRDYILDVEKNVEHSDVLSYLNEPVLSDEFVRKLHLEQEIMGEFERVDKELQEYKKALREEKKISKAKDKELQKKAKELEKQRSVIENLVRSLLLAGKSKEEISILTGISVSNIEKLI